METHPGVPFEPALYLGMFVGGIVVDDDMDVH